jgi:hypothetical protein
MNQRIVWCAILFVWVVFVLYLSATDADIASSRGIFITLAFIPSLLFVIQAVFNSTFGWIIILFIVSLASTSILFIVSIDIYTKTSNVLKPFVLDFRSIVLSIFILCTLLVGIWFLVALKPKTVQASTAGK